MKKKEKTLETGKDPKQTELPSKQFYVAPSIEVSYVAVEPFMSASLKVHQNTEDFNHSWETDPDEDIQVEW